MPEIPTFENEIQPHLAATPQASPAAFALPGEAIERAGGVLSAEMGEFNARYQEGRRAVAASDIAMTSHAMLQDASHQSSLIPDRVKALSDFDSRADAIKSKVLDPITDPMVRQMVAHQLDENYIVQSGEVSKESFRREASDSLGTLDLQLDSLSHDYAEAGSDFDRAQVIDHATQAINARTASGYMGGAEGAQALIGFRKRADSADAKRDIDADPAAAYEKLEDDKNYPHLDELTRGRYLATAQRAMDRKDVGLTASVRQGYEDNLASRAATGEDATPLAEADIRKAFPYQADVMLRELNLAAGTFQAKTSMALTNQQQDEALLGKWEPHGVGFKGQEEANAIVQKAANTKWKQIADDPAAYVMGAAPDVADAFARAAKDPTQTKAALTALDTAYDKLGLAPQDRTVLSVGASIDLARSITGDPNNAPARIARLEQQYGPQYWPRAWHDLVKDGKLPVAYQALGELDATDGAMLGRWLGEQQPGKAAADVIGEKTVTTIKNHIRTDPGVHDLVTSLAASGSSVDQVNGYIDAIDNLAFAKTYYGKSPSAEADAIKAFVGKYEFMPDGGARVPRERYDDVQQVAADTLHGLSLDSIAVPPIFGSSPGAPKPEEYLDLVRASPNWITSPNGDALWLKDTYGRIVRTKTGAPLAVPFAAKPAPGANRPFIGMPGSENIMGPQP